jgi:hypothetical protein
MLAVQSSKAFVSVIGVCRRSDGGSPAVQTIEEYMPVGPLLRAVTLNDALEYFISKTDAVAELQRVDSFKVNGHELLHTFIDQPAPTQV